MSPYEYTLAALLRLPVYKEDVAETERKRQQFEAVATEVAKLKPPAGVAAREWRAIVVAVGEAESGYSLRIMAGQCKPYECDHGRARSAWQMHENNYTRPVWEQLWGQENLAIQVQAADGMLKRAYYRCEKEQPDGFWVEQTFLAYAGRNCKQTTIEPWKGLALRVGYWRLAFRAMG